MEFLLKSSFFLSRLAMIGGSQMSPRVARSACHIGTTDATASAESDRKHPAPAKQAVEVLVMAPTTVPTYVRVAIVLMIVTSWLVSGVLST